MGVIYFGVLVLSVVGIGMGSIFSIFVGRFIILIWVGVGEAGRV